MNTYVMHEVHARRTPLFACLAVALGVGVGLGAVPVGAQAAEQPASQQPLPSRNGTPRDRRAAHPDLFAKRAAALLANKSPPRPDGGLDVPVTNCNDEGVGSLRDAVQNIAVSGDTVDMTGLDCSTITLISGAIMTTADDLTIVGPGSDMNGVTILSGHNSQIFVHLGSGALTLEYLTVINGGKYSTGTSDALGGCVFSYGLAVLRDAGIKYCVAEAQGSGYAQGGGVYARTGIVAASSTISGNAVRADRSPPSGGGLYTPGSLLMNYSWVHSNEAAEITSQRVAFGGGGGLWTAGDATILNSTVSGNTAAVIGGASLRGVDTNANLVITNTTICDNYSYASPFGSGLSVNSPIIISNSTISGNVARNSANIISGAGLYLGEYAAATLQSTIVSGNSFYNGTTSIPDDIGHSPFGGTLVGGANNLVGHSTLPLTLDTIQTSDPGLGTLTNGNGGPTPTRAPLSGSAAINHGNNVSDRQYDQRGIGFPRVVGRFADIGAVESDVLFSDGFDG